MQKNNFAGYKLNFAPRAEKSLKKLEKIIAQKVREKLQDLIQGTPNLDIEKMKGIEETYRLKFHDYRIIFEVDKKVITILVVDIAHRKEIYRNY